MFRFVCVHCGRRLKVSAELAGKKVQCSGCKRVILVPFPEGSSYPTPPSAEQAAAAGGPLIRPPRALAEGEGIDMTAMVDIVFFLLIFFLVTSMHSLQASMEMPPPEAQEGASARRSVTDYEQDQDYVIVRIDPDDTVWVENAEAPSPQEMLAKLREAKKERADAGKSTKLLVLASADAHHGTVVTVLDAGNEAGMERLRLAMEDDE